MPRPPTTLFEDAIDVPAWLEADRLTPYPQRVGRDRDIARGLTSSDRLARVRAWWRVAGADATATTGARLERMRELVAPAMAVIGALAGVLVALAAFQYDGSQPVNVVRLMALLVGLPLLFLLLTLLLLPGRVPGLRRLQDLLVTINPGALAAAAFRRFARSPDLVGLLDWHATRAGAPRFAKWQLLYWAQVAAVAYNVAALITAIVLVTFTDLAFGWSTTLDADPAKVTRIVRAIAWPWHAIAPYAVPDAALVEQSQFFRLRGGAGLASDASRTLTGWWPFTVFATVTYGLLPRLVLLIVAAIRLRAATAALLLDHAQVTALLDRMTAPAIETAGTEREPEPMHAGAAQAAHPEITGTAQAVIWEGSLPPATARDYARSRLGLQLTSVVEAGGARALDADTHALEQIAASDGRTLVVFTPAWEPPLLELLDFLGALRRRIGSGVSIIVTPVPEDATGAVSDVERETWTRTLGRLTDPMLYVETGAA